MFKVNGTSQCSGDRIRSHSQASAPFKIPYCTGGWCGLSTNVLSTLVLHSSLVSYCISSRVFRMVREVVPDCLWRRSSCNHVLCLLEEVITLKVCSSLISDNYIMASISETDWLILEWLFLLGQTVFPYCLRTVTDPVTECCVLIPTQGEGKIQRRNECQCDTLLSESHRVVIYILCAS